LQVEWNRSFFIHPFGAAESVLAIEGDFFLSGYDVSFWFHALLIKVFLCCWQKFEKRQSFPFVREPQRLSDHKSRVIFTLGFFLALRAADFPLCVASNIRVAFYCTYTHTHTFIYQKAV